MIDFRENFGARFREARYRRGLSQQEVSERANINVELYSRIERGLSYPSLKTFTVLAQILAVSTDNLLGLSPLQYWHPGNDAVH